MRLILHRLAKKEYYKTCRQLGHESIVKRNRFDQSLREAFDRVRENPQIGSPSSHSTRWVRVGRFKWLVYYRQLHDDLIFVYAIAHGSRRPGYWLQRTKKP